MLISSLWNYNTVMQHVITRGNGWKEYRVSFLTTAYEPTIISNKWFLKKNLITLKKKQWLSEWVSEVAQSCPTLCDPMDSSLSGASVHGIFQARVLQWIAISFSRGSSGLRNRTRVSRIAGRRFTVWATREAHYGTLILWAVNRHASKQGHHANVWEVQ